MIVFLRFFGAQLKSLLGARVSFPQSMVGRVLMVLSVLGIGSLGYLCGAAVLFFQLPSSDFLNKSFTGAKAWYVRGRSTIPPLSPEDAASREAPGGVALDRASKTYDGFTLFTMTDAARATLIDMRGKVVHRWQLPFSQAWPHPPHVANPLADGQIHWFRCHLYPNGDLLAIYHADGDTPYGYGLVKLDKDSKLLWAYANNVHHDVDVDEDGTIYTLTQKLERTPPAGLEFLPTPYLTDSLVILSREGRELENIPLLEAFGHSAHVLLLASAYQRAMARNPGGGPQSPRSLTYPTSKKNDVLHTNSVQVLSRTLASKFPLFHTGQVLLSVRNLSLLAVVDRPTRRITWAVPGAWQRQHDAKFLDNGHLLLYDNFGARGTRVLEYDPLTQAIPWVFANDRSISFRAGARGMKQRLGNGNTLIVEPDRRRLFEVTPSKEVVWEYLCPLLVDSRGLPTKAHGVTGARRYRSNELTFLKGVARARP